MDSCLESFVRVYVQHAVITAVVIASGKGLGSRKDPDYWIMIWIVRVSSQMGITLRLVPFWIVAARSMHL